MIVRLAKVLDTDPNSLLYPAGKENKKTYRPISMKPVLWTFVFFFLGMTWGSGIFVALFQKICGGGVNQSFLYPIYGGIIMLAVLIAVCTCVVIEEIRNIGVTDEIKEA